MVLSPLTNSNEVTLLATIPVDRLIHDWKSFFKIDVEEEFHRYKEIYLYQCNKTKIKFFFPFNIAGSNKFYEQLHNYKLKNYPPGYYMSNRWEHQIGLQDLSDCQNILEIGSGSGHFVKSCIDTGLNIRGIELNEASVMFAQESNLPVERLDLKKAADLFFESLEGVCSFQVLEHIPNPKDFINWSIQCLKPGGKLIYSVPNSGSFLKYLYELLDMPPHHMLRWSEDSLKSLENIFPLKLEKMIREPLASYHVSTYLTAYSSHFRSVSPFGNLVFNPYTIRFYRKCLDFGLRKLMSGHSIYVQFRKIR